MPRNILKTISISGTGLTMLSAPLGFVCKQAQTNTFNEGQWLWPNHRIAGIWRDLRRPAACCQGSHPVGSWTTAMKETPIVFSGHHNLYGQISLSEWPGKGKLRENWVVGQMWPKTQWFYGILCRSALFHISGCRSALCMDKGKPFSHEQDQKLVVPEAEVPKVIFQVT